ncbi:MAG: patatin-like phospholipase family protein, partial [Actinomycetota bacterium]|nr:patatin-like phospholipase family protein [Actinomycetota bacterium]
MKIGLVLGGGGLVGMAYHAGALKALDDLGVDADRFDTIVGTSAGSILGSYLATGWALDDFYEYAFGRHPKARQRSEDEHAEHRQLFTPMWTTGGERVRRSIGSLFALASSRGFWRAGGKLPHAHLRRLFPAGMYSTAESRARLNEDLPLGWPDRELFVCAAELYSGARVAFGHPDAPDAPLPDAVL